MVVKALQPPVSFPIMHLEKDCLPEELDYTVRTLVFIDSMILLSGMWNTFSMLLKTLPEIEVIGLTVNLTVNLVSRVRIPTLVLEQIHTVNAFKRELANIIVELHIPSRKNFHLRLTKTKSYLLTYFFCLIYPRG